MNQIYYYNSLSNNLDEIEKQSSKNMMNQIYLFFKDYCKHNIPNEPEFIYANCPNQTNDIDCGLYVISFISDSNAGNGDINTDINPNYRQTLWNYINENIIHESNQKKRNREEECDMIRK